MHKSSDFHLQIDYYKSFNSVTATAKPVSLAIYPVSQYFFTINIVDEILIIAHP